MDKALTRLSQLSSLQILQIMKGQQESIIDSIMSVKDIYSGVDNLNGCVSIRKIEFVMNTIFIFMYSNLSIFPFKALGFHVLLMKGHLLPKIFF